MKIWQQVIRNAPRSRPNPAGKTQPLGCAISAECWNFSGPGELWPLAAGQLIKVCHVYDSEHFTCEAVDATGECPGIPCGDRLGYRFIISNRDLRRAGFRPVPRSNYDLIGAIIDAES